MGIHTNELYAALADIQEVFDRIRNVPSDKKIEYDKLKEIRLNWKQQAEKIEKGEKTVVGRNQIDVEGEVDTETPGEYVIKFSMTVDAGNQETVTGSRRIYVMVRDN